MTRNLEVLQLPEDRTSCKQLPKPHRQWAQNDVSEKDILDIIAKAIATALDDREKQKEAKADVKTDF